MSQVASPPAKAGATGSNASRSALSERIRTKFESCGKGIGNVSRKLREATGKVFKRLWRGDVDEKKKIVLERGLKRALMLGSSLGSVCDHDCSIFQPCRLFYWVRVARLDRWSIPGS